MKIPTETNVLVGEVQNLLQSSLEATEQQSLAGHGTKIVTTAASWLVDDLVAYALHDPASHGRLELILKSYASFKAVMCYRLAQQVWQLDPGLLPQRELIAQTLSNKGKLLSGIEIHPGAQIGRRFVLDHGYGTVIGETCLIGDDCYILSNVILGATGISSNRDGTRHPRIGNRVQIGSGARILGPVRIGSDVFISPLCVIVQDVPSKVKVCITNQVQLQKLNASTSRRYVSAFATEEHLHLAGDLPKTHEVNLVDAFHHKVPTLKFERTFSSPHHMEYRLNRVSDKMVEPTFPLHLHVSGNELDVTVMDPPGLNALVRQFQKADAGLSIL